MTATTTNQYKFFISSMKFQFVFICAVFLKLVGRAGDNCEIKKRAVKKEVKENNRRKKRIVLKRQQQ